MDLPCDSPFLNRLAIDAFESDDSPAANEDVLASENRIGAFRGLAYGIAFQAGAAALGFVLWEILRRLI